MPTMAILLALAALSAKPAVADRTIVQMETNFGDVVIALYANEAPITVNNFLGYVNRDFYEGLIFHRTIDDFMIQTGIYDDDLYLVEGADFDDPNWTKDPNFYHEPNDPIEDEADNGFANDRGTVAMALSGPNTGTSQFFINQAAAGNSHLNGIHTVFGEVIEGMDVVDEIAGVDTHTIGEGGEYAIEDVPVEPVFIEQITVTRTFDANSADFGEVAFLGAQAGLLRTFIGQDDQDGTDYQHTFSEDELMGVKCLKWRRTTLEGSAGNIDSFDIYMARDTDDTLWVLKYVADDETEFVADSLLEAQSFSDFGAGHIEFKLISGDYNPDNLSDPNNSITFGFGSSAETFTIESFTASLDAFPAYAGELVLVKRTIAADVSDIDWFYYHTSVGLVLDLHEDSGDPTGEGWRLAPFNFDSTSNDLSEIDFLHATGGDIRMFVGQGDYSAKHYDHSFSTFNFLGITCTKWYQRRVTSADITSFYFYLAKDTNGSLWVLKYYEGGELIFEADSLLDAKPLSDYGQENMYYRLISGDYDPNNLDAPANTVTRTTDDEQITEQIISFHESLDELPYYEDDLILVKQTIGGEDGEVRWGYYHTSIGLVLDLREELDGNSIYDLEAWRLAWYGRPEPSFADDSDDLNDLPFVHARPGDTRIYRGQGAQWADLSLRVSFDRELLLEVNCLRMETGTPLAAITGLTWPLANWYWPGNSIYLARDQNGGLWVFKMVIDDQTVFEAADIDQIVPAEKFMDMHLRLISGDYESDTAFTDSDGVHVEIVSLDESLDRFTAFDDKLVLVKSSDDAGAVIEWAYFHTSTGRVLDLWYSDTTGGGPQDIGDIDPNSSGWYLSEPNDLDNATIRLKAGKDRSASSDSFVLSCPFVGSVSDLDAGELFVHVGPYRTTINTNSFSRPGNKELYVYQGYPDGSVGSAGYVLLKLDLQKHTLRLAASKTDLTGMAEPIAVTISVGPYHTAGIAQVNARKGAPIRFLQGYADALRLNRYMFAYDNGPNAYNSNDLVVHGRIATRLYPLDLEGKQATISWQDNDFTIPAGSNGLVRRGNQEIYSYRSGGSSGLVAARFNLRDCTFRIAIRKTHLSHPVQDLSIEFATDTGGAFQQSVSVGQ